MSVEIKQAASLSAEEWERLFGWGEDIFGADELNLSWRAKDWHFLIYEDGEPVSHAAVLKHTVAVGEKPVVVGGVGGVVTHERAQGKGYARTLMRKVADFLENEWRVEAGLLFCLPRMIPFYESLGWQLVEEPVFIEQPSGAIKSPMSVMVLPFGGNEWGAGQVELQSLPW
jgi:GNAT superfamily N-acetyltransferase